MAFSRFSHSLARASVERRRTRRRRVVPFRAGQRLQAAQGYGRTGATASGRCLARQSRRVCLQCFSSAVRGMVEQRGEFRKRREAAKPENNGKDVATPSVVRLPHRNAPRTSFKAHSARSRGLANSRPFQSAFVRNLDARCQRRFKKAKVGDGLSETGRNSHMIAITHSTMSVPPPSQIVHAISGTLHSCHRHHILLLPRKKFIG